MRVFRRARCAAACLALLAFAGSGRAQAALPAGAIAFVHEDSGSTDPVAQIFNIRLLDAQDPSRQVVLTSFGTAPALVENLAWSRDFGTIAFAANVNNGLRSLEEESIYAIGAGGTRFRQLTGFGLLADLSGPTGVVTGRVVAPTLVVGSRSIPAQLGACVVSAQGTSVTAACEPDGSFRLANVPAGSTWVRAQGDVEYFDAVLGISGGPGLSLGFAPIAVHGGQTTAAGAVRIDPQIGKSIYPAWAPGDTRLLVTSHVRAVVLRQNPYTFAYEWQPTRGSGLAVWDLGGGTGPTAITLPGPADVADLSAGDWSPAGDRIACAASGMISGASGSFVLLVNPDGTAPELVYKAPLSLMDPTIRLVLQARWSPDGGRIAVVESAVDAYNPMLGRSDILVMNADGSDVRRITASAATEFAGSPTWSPDGQVVAYHVAIVPTLATLVVERSDLFAVRADGTERVRLSDDGRSSQPAWRNGGLEPLPPPCLSDDACSDANPCTTDRCSAGACLFEPIGGFAGARCAVSRVDGTLCDAGAVSEALERFIARRVGRSLESLQKAEVAGKPKRRGASLTAADRRLEAVARRVTKAARKKKRPLAAACRDRILEEIGAARGVVGALGNA